MTPTYLHPPTQTHTSTPLLKHRQCTWECSSTNDQCFDNCVQCEGGSKACHSAGNVGVDFGLVWGWQGKLGQEASLAEVDQQQEEEERIPVEEEWEEK